jgi:hypothetical protein
MTKLRVPFILHCLIFLLPVNIFVAGDWISVGIQWALFQYQQGNYGTSLTSVTNNINYLSFGLVGGKSAISAIIWILAAILLIGSFIFNIATLLKYSQRYLKIASFIIIICGVLFAISDIIQYGISFNGPAGFCIPVGIPIILIIGWWTYRYDDAEEWLHTEKPNCRIRISNEVSLLVFVLIFTKIVVLALSLFHVAVLRNIDVSLYHSYAGNALSGQIPYADYYLEYPQFFLIPALVAAIPTLVIAGDSIYILSWIFLMSVVDIAVLVCVYFIAIRLFGQEKAFLCGLLYATAFFSLYASSFSYDIVPTLFLMLSILLFLHGREIPAYISAAAGFLTKWFPAACFPFFILYTLKNRNDTTAMKKGIVISCIIIFLSVIPFIILNLQGFLKTYWIHLWRSADVHSLIYYLDVIAKKLMNIRPFGEMSLILLFLLECILLFWYYRYSSGKPVMLCFAIFFSVFLFILLNNILTPYFIIWIVPFLALFLIESYWQILLFYLIQLIMYLESPVLQGIVYARGKPYEIIDGGLPSFTFIFYTIKFLFFFFLLFVLIQNMKKSDTLQQKIPTYE